jgi:hypothetical protein
VRQASLVLIGKDRLVRDSLWLLVLPGLLTEGDALEHIPFSPRLEVYEHVTWSCHDRCGWSIRAVREGSDDFGSGASCDLEKFSIFSKVLRWEMVRLQRLRVL